MVIIIITMVTIMEILSVKKIRIKAVEVILIASVWHPSIKSKSISHSFRLYNNNRWSKLASE